MCLHQLNYDGFVWEVKMMSNDGMKYLILFNPNNPQKLSFKNY